MLVRRGHTEAAVDLARLAGLTPAGVLVEVVNDDGTMKRGAASCATFADEHGLRADLDRATWSATAAAPRRYVERVAETRLPTRHGDFTAYGYRITDRRLRARRAGVRRPSSRRRRAGADPGALASA